MATAPRTPPVPFAADPDTRLLRELAQRPDLAGALQWFLRERHWITDRQLELCRVPAATFFEQARAEWFKQQLTSVGWKAEIDRAGNVLARFGQPGTGKVTIVSAHLDTVYAPGKPDDIYTGPDGRLFGPGTSDNGSGLVALLAIAKVLALAEGLDALGSSILIVANVGEEGEGNLSGMRYLCQNLRLLGIRGVEQIRAFLVLDGPSIDHITAQALASQRYELTFTGPGGHSWNDHGTANPVHAVAQVISNFSEQAEQTLSNVRRGLASYNFGVIEGGSSINSIPSLSRTKLDIRSEDPALLVALAGSLTAIVERVLEQANRNARAGKLSAKIKDLGSRPGGRMGLDTPLLGAIRAVDAFLNIRSRVDCASTDANVPLSLGLPAISIGSGGRGGGAHTAGEWYSAEGRELGLRRILLLLALLAQ